MFDSYYGSYRTRKLTDIYTKADDLISGYQSFPAAASEELTTAQLQTIYYLLYARYGNSHISYSDENQFKYALYSGIWQYGPIWAKKVEIQKMLRGLSEDELITGGKAIYNHSFNPSSAPSTSTLEELLTINDQNTTNYKKSKMEAYGMLWGMLDTDVTTDFLDKFKKLFITITAPDYPLLYETEIDDNEST